MGRRTNIPAILSAMTERAADSRYASNTLLKASPLFGTVTGCFQTMAKSISEASATDD